MAQIQITDLTQALNAMVFHHNDGSRYVVERLRIVEAPALKELVDLQDDVGKHCVVRNKHNVKRLARADALLALLDLALLPALEVFPTEPDAVNTLRLYDGKLFVPSKAVGGTFRERYRDMHESFALYVDDASAEPLNVSVDDLRARINAFIPRVKALREGEYTIRQYDKR